MAFSAKTAAETISSEVSGNPSAMAAVRAESIAPGDFCALWTKAKPILEVVAGLVVLIPGLGAVAAGVLRGLIKVGDQISAEVCG